MNNQTQKLMYVKKAGQAVLDERQRQITDGFVAIRGRVEFWTSEHDDNHLDGQLAATSGCHIYAELPHSYMDPTEAQPRHEKWWKPRNYRGNLIKAGALILAEIERLDRQ